VKSRAAESNSGAYPIKRVYDNNKKKEKICEIACGRVATLELTQLRRFTITPNKEIMCKIARGRVKLWSLPI